MRRQLTIIFFLLQTYYIFSQEEQKKISIVFGVGYKASTSGFLSIMPSYKLKNRIEFSIGPYWNILYVGQGVSTSARVYYLLDKKLFLNTEIAYRYLFSASKHISPADHESDVGDYYVPSNNFGYIAEGINYILSGKRDKLNKNRRINLSLYYGIPFQKYNCKFTGGIESSEIEQQINSRLMGGFGLSFSFTW